MDNGLYTWNISCNSTGHPDYIFSENRQFVYDTIVPGFNNYTTDNSTSYPEIGDTITMTVNVTDNFTINSCELWMNDTTVYELKNTYSKKDKVKPMIFPELEIDLSYILG